VVIVDISVFPSFVELVDAAFAAKVKAGEIAMVAAAAPAESSALRRVMEEKFSVMSYPAILSFQASDDAVARLMGRYCRETLAPTIASIISSLLHFPQLLMRRV
jgi:hypothetical protein